MNKLSCGLYSVPAGRDGSFRASWADQRTWKIVVETPQRYSQNVAAASGLKGVLSRMTYKAPCTVSVVGEEEVAARRRCGGGFNASFTVRTCTSLSFDAFADVMLYMYSK